MFIQYTVPEFKHQDHEPKPINTIDQGSSVLNVCKRMNKIFKTSFYREFDSRIEVLKTRRPNFHFVSTQLRTRFVLGLCYLPNTIMIFFIKPHSHPNGFYWGQQCSWTLTPANSMQVSIMQFDNCNRK